MWLTCLPCLAFLPRYEVVETCHGDTPSLLAFFTCYVLGEYDGVTHFLHSASLHPSTPPSLFPFLTLYLLPPFPSLSFSSFLYSHLPLLFLFRPFLSPSLLPPSFLPSLSSLLFHSPFPLPSGPGQPTGGVDTTVSLKSPVEQVMAATSSILDAIRCRDFGAYK